jgi:plasmid rolling circle replication initiator protein Rep
MNNYTSLPLQKQGNSHLPHTSRFLKKPVAASSLISGEAKYVHTNINNSASVFASEENNRLATARKSRLANKKATKDKLIRYFVKLGEDKLASDFALCHKSFSRSYCSSSVCENPTLRVIPNFNCKHRLCPFCSYIRQKRIQNKYLPTALEFANTLYDGKRLKTKMLTLTLKHRKESLLDAKRRLYNSFIKLSRRSFWQAHIVGGLYAIESTIADDGKFHVHLHVLVFEKSDINKEKLQILKDEWKEITGDSHVINIRRINDIKVGLKEVIKYISKPVDIGNATTKHIRQMLNLKGERMIGTFGKFKTYYRDNHERIDAEYKDQQEVNYGSDNECACCGEELTVERISIEELIRRPDTPRPKPKLNEMLVQKWLVYPN